MVRDEILVTQIKTAHFVGAHGVRPPTFQTAFITYCASTTLEE